ncbi:MAG TPA: CpsD/CapB family tyrosine-protein kinase [Bacilli bacterium]|nr:CpsD/CapB family tyrosine-protein kinase [Bacilli bacterium]
MKLKEHARNLIALYQPKSPIAEAFRTLRTNIQFAGVSKDLRTMMVTSSGPGEGKSTTIANLAIVSAQAGKKVLLIDADLRKPTVHRTFNVSNRTGLTNMLIGQAEYGDCIRETGQIRLDVISSGPIPPNPAELLGSQRMKDLLEQLKEHYDMIYIDTPPILAVTDAQLLASHVDGVVLVLSAGKVLRDHAKKAKALLNNVGANVVGAVLNNKKVESESYYYYYYGEDN